MRHCNERKELGARTAAGLLRCCMVCNGACGAVAVEVCGYMLVTSTASGDCCKAVLLLLARPIGLRGRQHRGFCLAALKEDGPTPTPSNTHGLL